MFQLYKDLMIWYFVLAISGGVSIVIALFDYSMFFALVLAFVYILVCAIVFHIIANARIKKAISLMFDKCCCKEYIAYFEKLFSKANKKTELFLRCNLSAGYTNGGQPEKGLLILTDFIPTFTYKGAELLNIAVYYNNLFAAYLQLKDIENAEKALTGLKYVVDNPKLLITKQADMLKLYIRNSLLLKIERNDFSNAEEFFSDSFNKSENLLGKAVSSYVLAKIYINTGNMGKAEQYIAFAAQNGGDTVFAEKARKRDFT